jgi:iron complex outermembrane receptor protein
MRRIWLIGAFIGFLAQSQVQQLDEVVLRAQRINSPIQPLSTTLISDSLQLLLQQDIGERLHAVPSLFVSSQQNFTQDTRISIRGFGARAAFGIRGIKILLDGIPITTPDGQTQMDHIPLSQLGTIEVLRGLSGGLYGNASGGVVLLKSKPITSQKNLSLTFADFASRTVMATFSDVSEQSRFRAIVEHKTQRGYRMWSAYENTLVSLSNAVALGNNKSLTLDYTFFNSPNAQDAGGLTLGEVTQNRRKARQANIDYSAGEKVMQHTLSARWKTGNWASYVFYTHRQLDACLPFTYGGQIDLGRHYFGLGAQQDGSKNNWKWHYGIESSAQLDARKRFKNNLGIKGVQTLHQNEHFYSLGSFGILEKQVGAWHVRGALRVDIHQISLNDFVRATSDKSTLSALSPNIAFHREFSRFFSGYLRWGTGFETPSLNELSANPTGETGLNTALKPQQSEAVEIGFRFDKKIVHLGLTLFHTTTYNEIVPYEIAVFPGQTFYANVGQTLRKGIELENRLALTPQTTVTMAMSRGSYTTNTKKALPNVPQNQFSSGIQHRLKKGVFILNLRHVGERFADNENAIRVPSFWTSDVSFQRHWKGVRATFGVTNVANARYFDNIRSNAFGGRYYEPAAERQAYFRVVVSL